MFRSVDNGENWEKIVDNDCIYDVVITPTGEIYYGEWRQRIYYSNDNGYTWTDKSYGLLGQPGSLALGKDGTLYAGTTDYGVYHSTNGGDSWLPSSNNKNINAQELTVSNDGLVFAAADGDGVLKSTDRGVTWTKITSINNPHRIICNPIIDDIFVGGDGGIYRSTDLGTSWKLENSGLSKHKGQYMFTYTFGFNPNTGQMYSGSGDCFYRSKNHTNIKH